MYCFELLQVILYMKPHNHDAIAFLRYTSASLMIGCPIQRLLVLVYNFLCPDLLILDDHH